MTQQSTTNQRKLYTDGLRAVADFYDSHPDVPLPYNREFSRYVKPDEFAAAARALGGQRSKTLSSSDYARVSREVAGFTIYVSTDRAEVCEQVQVGVQTVERQEIVTPAVTRTVTVEEPVMEWQCGPMLGQIEVAEARKHLHEALANGPSR